MLLVDAVCACRSSLWTEFDTNDLLCWTAGIRTAVKDLTRLAMVDLFLTTWKEMAVKLMSSVCEISHMRDNFEWTHSLTLVSYKTMVNDPPFYVVSLKMRQRNSATMLDNAK
jgi:hypothetical protein